MCTLCEVTLPVSSDCMGSCLCITRHFCDAHLHLRTLPAGALLLATYFSRRRMDMSVLNVTGRLGELVHMPAKKCFTASCKLRMNRVAAMEQCSLALLVERHCHHTPIHLSVFHVLKRSTAVKRRFTNFAPSRQW